MTQHKWAGAPKILNAKVHPHNVELCFIIEVYNKQPIFILLWRFNGPHVLIY